VTLKNGGATSVAISSITISGNFSKTTTCGTSLGAGKSCAVKVTFTPTALGARTGVLTFNLASGALSVPLTGTGTKAGTSEEVTVSPTSLNFGQQVLNDSITLTTTVTNSDGIVTGLAGIKITGGSGMFKQNNKCGTSLAAGASCTVSVTFTATAYGTFNATLSVTESAGAVHAVTLTGSGVTGN